MKAAISARRCLALGAIAALLAVLPPAGAMAAQLEAPAPAHSKSLTDDPRDDYGESGTFGSGKIASAKLVLGKKKVKSFKRAQAQKVKLSVKFQPQSRKFNYLLQLKKKGKWTKVKALYRTGAFRGTRSWSVKSLFAGKALKAGQYRLKLSADRNSKTLTFRVTT